MLLFIAPISNMFPIHAYNQRVLLILLVHDKTIFSVIVTATAVGCPRHGNLHTSSFKDYLCSIFVFFNTPCLQKLRIILMPSFPLVEQNIQFPLRLWCTMRCVSVCCSTEGLAPSAADQGVNFYDILLHSCPQSNGLEVLSKASLFFMYQHEVVLSLVCTICLY